MCCHPLTVGSAIAMQGDHYDLRIEACQSWRHGLRAGCRAAGGRGADVLLGQAGNDDLHDNKGADPLNGGSGPIDKGDGGHEAEAETADTVNGELIVRVP